MNKIESFNVFMCKTDFDYDVQGAHDGARAYPSEGALRAERPCVAECGIVEVRMTLVRVVQPADYGWADICPAPKAETPEA